MINEAIKKITEEAMSNGSPAFRAIEEHLTSICNTNAVAEKILSEGKTIKGAYEAMKSEAKKMAKGKSEVCISDEEGFRIVDEYFGISTTKTDAPVIDVLDLL